MGSPPREGHEVGPAKMKSTNIYANPATEAKQENRSSILRPILSYFVLRAMNS